MVSDLIKKLRACSSQERKDVAMELAHTRTNEAIRELIKMVEGRRRRWLSWYNLDDQLIGIEGLGETNSLQAVTYLRKAISKKRVQNVEINDMCIQGQESYSHFSCDITFPKARGKLKKTLRCSVKGSAYGPEWGPNYAETDSLYHEACELVASHDRIPSHYGSGVYRWIYQTLEKLESMTQNTSV